MCSHHYSMRMYARNGAARFPVLVVTGSNSAEQIPLKAHSNLTPVRHAHVSVGGCYKRTTPTDISTHMSVYSRHRASGTFWHAV